MSNNKTVVDKILDSLDANDYYQKRKNSFNQDNYMLKEDTNKQANTQQYAATKKVNTNSSNTQPVLIKKEDQYYFNESNTIAKRNQTTSSNSPTVNVSKTMEKQNPSYSDSKIKIKKEMNTLQDINNMTLVHLLSNREKTFSKSFTVKIIGIGGAGNNIVKYMVNSQQWPDFCEIIALNTDYVALSNLGDNLKNIFILGADELNGNGSGGNPDVGKKAAEADIEVIKTMLEGTDILILVAGLGKGTGTGATPIIAKTAQDLGILTIGLFNLPSIGAEGEKTYSNALMGLQNLSYVCNGLTTVNNDKIINVDKEKMSIKRAYESANKYIKTIVEEIINIITIPSDVNVDFADVKNFFDDKNGFLFVRINVTDYTKDGIKDAIETGILTGFSDVIVKNSEKALVNFKLNENVPSYVLENTRSALKEIVESSNVNIVHGVAYNDVFEDAEINILLTGTFELSVIEEVDPKLLNEAQPESTSPNEATSSSSIYDALKDLDNNRNNQNISNSYPSTVKVLGLNEDEYPQTATARYSSEYGPTTRTYEPNQNQYYDDDYENYKKKKKKRSWWARLFRRNRDED